jgi:Smg protein
MKTLSEIEILSYIFENHCCSTELVSPLKQQETLIKMQREGYAREPVVNAFNWFVDLLTETAGENIKIRKKSLRVYDRREMEKLGKENISFITTLELVGILSPKNREVLINQLMNLQQNKIRMLDIKWVMLMILSNEFENEEDVAKQVELFSLIVTAENRC